MEKMLTFRTKKLYRAFGNEINKDCLPLLVEVIPRDPWIGSLSRQELGRHEHGSRIGIRIAAGTSGGQRERGGFFQSQRSVLILQ